MRVFFRRAFQLATVIALVNAAAACSDEPGDGDAGDAGDASPDTGVDADADAPERPLEEDWTSDILHIDLSADIETLEATATVELDPRGASSASFEVAGIDVRGVRAASGPIEHRVVDGRLDVLLPSVSSPAEVIVDYGFSVQTEFVGLLRNGSTNMWPCCCDNVLPCRSDPSEGQTFSLELLGVPDGQQAVYPAQIISNAPAYQLAWAVGEYQRTELGVTTAGTTLAYWTLPGTTGAAQGTANLVDIFDWLEGTFGPYPFGDTTGPVAVEWGPESFLTGMENHPFWHVKADNMHEEDTHAHEAIHGWIGDGVRIACWEDMVLSEGTTCYLTARVLGQVLGGSAEAAIWSSYGSGLDWVISTNDTVAWPAGCGALHASDDGVFNLAAYYKGAFFYRDLAEEVGSEALDQCLHDFFQERMGESAGMQDLLDHIQEQTGYDPSSLAEGWLRSLGRP